MGGVGGGFTEILTETLHLTITHKLPFFNKPTYFASLNSGGTKSQVIYFYMLFNKRATNTGTEFPFGSLSNEDGNIN